ncbi:Fe2+-dependent dioxygenase [Ostreiculturibacter nitratireducens]|uniref:Fe2+-dependent dioxygenase n=1 Tax=Ostreiculturibacter nitratireducens TaxID=3075226 RepID=UPI0031B61575
MFHLIEGLFDGPTLAALTDAAAALPFEDGRKTAGPLARGVKNNAQAAASPERDAVLAKVEAALRAHPVVQSAARPKAFARLAVSRYAGGQAYGLHVDDALMAGARTDLSFTLFLSDPQSYEGGALVVADRVEERGFKLPPGQAILYPSDTLHRVEPVTTGERLAIVGWITSWVRDPAQREILFDLDAAIAAEADRGGDQAQILRLQRSRSNLLRMWAT